MSCEKTETPVENPIPNQPTITNPVNNMSLGNCVNIQWEGIAHTEQYHIQIATDTSFQISLSLIEDELVANNNFQQTFDIANNSDLFVRMRAESSVGNSEWSEIINFSVSTNQSIDCFGVELARPSLIEPANEILIDDDYVTFSWQPIDGAEKYHLTISENSLGNQIYNNSSVYDNQRTVQDFEAGKRYYWQVRAITGGSTSSWSDTWFFDKQ
ncbi:MAG: fibronectin type III domain-containing protein [Chitinophagales bacterium]